MQVDHEYNTPACTNTLTMMRGSMCRGKTNDEIKIYGGIFFLKVKAKKFLCTIVRH
jgi:hypothetical protein